MQKPKENKPFLVFDCETDSFDGAPVTPFIWGWVTSQGDRGFTYSTQEFAAILGDFDGIALAHNGGKFDTVMLAEYYEEGEIKIINGRVAEVKIGKATVRDSFLIIPAPLSASGLKDDFDYEILNRDKKHLRKKNKAKIEKYLMQDCDALFALVERFYNEYGQRLTQAGAALVEWEKLGGKIRRWGGAHDTHFRQFYFGGRCEAFIKGELGDAWQYFDIKSSYPRAMQEEHPASHLRDYFVHCDIKKITPQSFARIECANYGCLPSRGKYVTEYLHHDDAREYYATGWEIIAGIECGAIKNIISATIWRPNELETLKPYTDKFYQLKLAAERAGDKIGRLIAKIFMNSLYGKFGAAAGEYKKYKVVKAGAQLENYSLHAEIGELDIIQKPDAGQFYDVALAASITGYARAALFRQMQKCDTVAYSDTDSIICKGGDFDVGENLGQWEHVHTLNNFYVAGKKLYAGKCDKGNEWVVAHKGFSALDTGHEDIIKAARGEHTIIKRSAPSINVTGRQSFITRTMRPT